jgi:hypothetical protein
MPTSQTTIKLLSPGALLRLRAGLTLGMVASRLRMTEAYLRRCENQGTTCNGMADRLGSVVPAGNGWEYLPLFARTRIAIPRCEYEALTTAQARANEANMRR